ncbi:MAG: formate/nitrite transporter family protein [Clostridiaceae bacterium]
MYSDEINKVSESAVVKCELLKKGKGRYLLASMLAGLYVGLGIMLIYSIGGALSSAESPFTKTVMGVSFGVALSLVIMAGSEIFTGNNFVMTIGYLKKTVSFLDLIKIWVFSFVGNLIGSIIGGYAFYASGLAKGPVAQFIVHTAEIKMGLTIHELIVRGILCNILVCLATWFTYKMKEETGRLIMIFWCLFAFITSGYEHSVANMTLFSISLLIPHTASVSLGGFIYNLSFVALGNIIGGAVVLAIPYYLISKEK